MHLIEQYGFSLIPTTSVLEEQYLLLKRNIEITCKVAQDVSKQFGVNSTNIAFQLNGPDFLSIHIESGKATFGIYNQNTKTISTKASASLFQGFSTSAFKSFGLRCFQTIEAISKGRELNLCNLDKAWTTYLEQKQKSEENEAEKQQTQTLTL